MTISEKSAYLKGLLEGMKLSTETDEGKLLAAIVDLLGDVTGKINDLNETMIGVFDELDEYGDYLDDLEARLPDDAYDDLDDDFEDEDDEDEDEDYDFSDEDEIVYEVECPCGNVIQFDEEIFQSGSIVCAQCGKKLEFSAEDLEEEPDEDSED